MEREKNKKPHICLLDKNKGENVMVVSLTKNPSKHNETARAILYVPSGGSVYEHSHDKEFNPDSEVYIMIKPNKDGKSYTLEVLDVAGSNSPTDKTSHSIEPSDEPQIGIAIKRGQDDGLWSDYTIDGETIDGETFIRNLGFQITLLGESIILSSTTQEQVSETVTITPSRDLIRYFSLEAEEHNTLGGLTKSTSSTEKEAR